MPGGELRLDVGGGGGAEAGVHMRSAQLLVAWRRRLTAVCQATFAQPHGSCVAGIKRTTFHFDSHLKICLRLLIVRCPPVRPAPCRLCDEPTSNAPISLDEHQDRQRASMQRNTCFLDQAGCPPGSSASGSGMKSPSSSDSGSRHTPPSS